ncbi:MAG: hypothetical protein KGD59_14125 [Candidatus Heimdallarchaeota archaeon]|nr:hypothetical protein [Candidatus Heimdallarchaeota archaeon]MBY8995684.1 hypothetical protein [Candidatus Heimdallarchaeota archaeon]
MKSLKKSIIGISLIGLFLLTLGSQLVAGETEEISVSENLGAITVSTEYLTVKIIPTQAHLMWWYGNKTDADEIYKLQLVKIREFVGADEVLDDQTELGGLSYNLITGAWVSDIVEGDDEVTITLSLEGLANGADVYLIMHIYTLDVPVEGTDQVTDALTEVKFDIIVDNWDFSPAAQGIAIQTYLTEIQHRHRVRVRNGTVAENGNTTRTMQFESEDLGDKVVAYAEWTNFANVYNDTDDLVETIVVGTTYFEDPGTPPTDVPGFAEGLGHLWITYPNYGDDYKMVHDPTIGINEDAFTNNLGLYLGTILGGLTLVSIIAIVIVRRRK